MHRRPVLAGAIVVLSLGAGLLSLVALRWIGFLGLPPVLFLTLLLVGLPVGGLLLVKIDCLGRRSLAGIVLIAASLAVLASLVFLVVIQWTQARIDLAGSDFAGLIASLFIRFLVAAVTFLPLFVGYGLVEFAAYRAGLRGLSGRSGLVYALNLAGLVLAFLGYRLLLVPLGTTGLFALGLASLLLAGFCLRPRWWPALATAVLCASTLLVPGRESLVVSLLETKTGKETLNHWRDAPNRLLMDRWTPHCRLSIVDTGWGVMGFYEGIAYWFYLRGMPDPGESPARYRRPDLAFTVLVRPGDKVAVLGSGGGVQVAAALRAGAGRVYAVEVVPEVLAALAGPLAERIEGIYADPRVTLVPQNARRFLEETREVFDIIVVASVESHLGGMRELFEPSQTMFTREALASMHAHLAPGGVLSVSKFTSVDRRGVIFSQVFDQLGRLGLRTRGYLQLRATGMNTPGGYDRMMARGDHYLVLAQKGKGPTDALATLDNFYRNTRTEVIREVPAATHLEITDDRAFATGMLVANLGAGALATGAAVGAGILLIIGLVLAMVLRRSREGARTSIASLAAGFNFMTLEYLLVYRLMDRLDIPMDATFLGMVLFAGLAAAGGVLLARSSSVRLVVIAPVLSGLLAAAAILWPAASVFLAAGAAFLTGTLFPRLLHGPDDRLVRVYVWDAYGTLWGGLAAVLVPLLAGFSGLQILCGVALALTAFLVRRVPTAGEATS